MLDFEKVLDMLGGLTLLKFFPADVSARLELAKLVGRMAANEAQVEWLVQRVLAVCNEWPGPVALRQIFCGKFKPQDGIEAGSTATFPDGPPSERRIEGPVLPALPPGHVVSMDRQLDDSIKSLAALKSMDPLERRRAESEQRRAAIEARRALALEGLGPEPEPPTNPDFKPITQADIDRAVQELREKKAKGEFDAYPSEDIARPQ